MFPPNKINKKRTSRSFFSFIIRFCFKHFMSGLKLTWIRRIIIYPESHWVKLLLPNIPHIMNISILGTVYLNNTAKRINNSFWSEILQSYVSFINKIHSKNQTALLSIPIWYNEDINNGKLYIPTLSKIGYNFECDFIDDTGQPLSHQSLTNLTNTHVNWLDYI